MQHKENARKTAQTFTADDTMGKHCGMSKMKVVNDQIAYCLPKGLVMSVIPGNVIIFNHVCQHIWLQATMSQG